MENVLIALFALAAILLIIFLVVLFVPEKKKPESRHDPDHAPNRKKRPSYDWRGFDHNHIHRNGTKYDEEGYDYFGYDRDGYGRYGYNQLGRNAKKQYNRLFDTTSCQEEGFFDPARYPIDISPHAVVRFSERLGVTDPAKAKRMTVDAYKYGKSKRQIKKTSAYLVEEIEQKEENSVVLIYKNYIYIFSRDNKLKTIYQNEKIPL